VLINFIGYRLILTDGNGRISSGTLVQVDSTVIIGVLFFLTLNSYLGFLPAIVGRSIIGFLTLSAIIPSLPLRSL
jgi:hypothetical protein